MISVNKNVKEGFKWFGRGERIEVSQFSFDQMKIIIL